jgi:hypothetical protein
MLDKICFSNLPSSRLLGEDPQYQLTLYSNYPRWVVTFLQMCYYKWRPKKCVSLDLANVIVSISKNGEKIPIY